MLGIRQSPLSSARNVMAAPLFLLHIAVYCSRKSGPALLGRDRRAALRTGAGLDGEWWPLLSNGGARRRPRQAQEGARTTSGGRLWKIVYSDACACKMWALQAGAAHPGSRIRTARSGSRQRSRQPRQDGGVGALTALTRLAWCSGECYRRPLAHASGHGGAATRVP